MVVFLFSLSFYCYLLLSLYIQLRDEKKNQKERKAFQLRDKPARGEKTTRLPFLLVV